MNLQEKAEQLSSTIFLGGPAKAFEDVGRLQLITLLREGLYPYSKVVDIGCGCLRAGYWLIHFLDKGCYFGIEPYTEMLRRGIDDFLENETLEEKRPRFDSNADFDTSVFGERFDFFLARSVWTHAAKWQIQRMLDSFHHDATESGVFLTSYKRAHWLRHGDYKGNKWIGRSHESDKPGMVYHSFKWIEKECARREMAVRELKEGVYNNQIWLRITRRR